MDANLRYLRTSVIEAIAILQRDLARLDARAHHTLAVLQAALLHQQRNVVEERPARDLDGPDTA